MEKSELSEKQKIPSGFFQKMSEVPADNFSESTEELLDKLEKVVPPEIRDLTETVIMRLLQRVDDAIKDTRLITESLGQQVEFNETIQAHFKETHKQIEETRSFSIVTRAKLKETIVATRETFKFTPDQAKNVELSALLAAKKAELKNLQKQHDDLQKSVAATQQVLQNKECPPSKAKWGKLSVTGTFIGSQGRHSPIYKLSVNDDPSITSTSGGSIAKVSK